MRLSVELIPLITLFFVTNSPYKKRVRLTYSLHRNASCTFSLFSLLRLVLTSPSSTLFCLIGFEWSTYHIDWFNRTID